MRSARIGPLKAKNKEISPPYAKRPKASRRSKPHIDDVSSSSSQDSDGEIASNRTSSLTFYPAFCFPVSPTYSTWVKLSCADVHHLQSRRGFEGQHIYFHTNHPVRFIRLVGRIVSVDEKPHAWIWILDDGSGRNIEVFCKKAPLPLHLTSTSTLIPGQVANGASGTFSSIYNADIGTVPLATWPGEEIHWRPPANYFSISTSASTASTNVRGNMKVSRHACQTSTGTSIDTSAIRLGSLIKLKGTIGEFGGEKQALLERFWILNSTTEEIQAWNELVEFRESVLSKPWVVKAEQIQALKKRAERKAGITSADRKVSGVGKMRK